MAMHEEVKNKWTERKFWMVIGTAVLMILNDAFGMMLDEETILKVLSAVLGWVFVEGGVDAAKILRRN